MKNLIRNIIFIIIFPAIVFFAFFIWIETDGITYWEAIQDIRGLKNY